jgi:hypothetical protein
MRNLPTHLEHLAEAPSPEQMLQYVSATKHGGLKKRCEQAPVHSRAVKRALLNRDASSSRSRFTSRRNRNCAHTERQPQSVC